MKSVTVNGEAREISDESKVADVVTEVTGRALTEDGAPRDGGRLGLAVALNGQVIPRSEWSRTAVPPETEIEVVTAVQGG